MTNNGDLPNIPVETIAETENYTVWQATEPDGEATYHLELGEVTVHYFGEEWNDFVQLIRDAAAQPDDEEDPDVEVELDWGSLYFTRDEWTEFLQLIEQV